MTGIQIPAAMREAALRVLIETDQTYRANGGYDDLRQWDDLTEEEQCEHYLSYVDAVLAAALGVCDVGVIYRVHSIAKSGDPEDDMWSGNYDTLDRAHEHISAFRDRDRGRVSEHDPVIERALEIYTPAEQVDTEGADRG